MAKHHQIWRPRETPTRRDRLSALPNATLVRVLSRLPTVEATRTSALSTRWRHVHAAVPAVDLVDPRSSSGFSYCRDPKICFDHQVTSAFLVKDSATPIRVFRFNPLQPPYKLADQWIATVLTSVVEEFDVKLRYHEGSHRVLCPFTRSPKASADFDDSEQNRFTNTPGQLLRCDTLRCLRLTHWTIDPPSDGVSLPSLETLFLKRITAPEGAVQQLISGCPRLADLTLEQCPTVTEITVTSPHLKTFAMVCCHNATLVTLHTEFLRSLRYKGGLPGMSFFTAASYSGVVAVAIHICERLAGRSPADVAPVRELIGRCTNLTFLHLSLRPAMAYFSGIFTPVFRGLHRLRQLSLRGVLDSDHTIRSVAALLQNTRDLDVLSLFPLCREPLPLDPNTAYLGGDSDSDDDDAPWNGKIPPNSTTEHVELPATLVKCPVKCFRRLRKIYLIGYEGEPLEKMLAKYLLSKAYALEEFNVTLATTTNMKHRDTMGRELAKWRSNYRTRINL